ncbi:PREDICTED: THAP domain-containing protein 1-like [Amphimedon queenslandica]|uniref:THAP-type domain-containing protein n=1 Tax=Amphimedon queenslandica TaxID=400682 RepID=A0AAN0INR5_AMPQE|nr:PREDICTED: THAP domain-containing protein 1-like [Amphimedon queenslandica]|eukprot:XP_011405485.1 PREDICTED: THAP domain-containing protein 1-like [Amphimedon queenslandica]
MPPYHSVVKCNNIRGKADVSFFRFPKNRVKNLAWVARLTRKNWKPSPHSRICSAHFVNGLLNVHEEETTQKEIITFKLHALVANDQLDKGKEFNAEDCQDVDESTETVEDELVEVQGDEELNENVELEEDED